MSPGSVLFGQSYYLRFDPKLLEARMPYAPLGSLYAAACIREKGYPVSLFDAMLAESEQGWLASLEEVDPEYAVLFEDNFNYLSKMCLLRMREAAYRMIEMARRRGCTVIVCGADATDHPDGYLSRGADFVLLGEGEITLGELLDRLETGERAGLDEADRAPMPLGLAWRSRGDPTRVESTGRRPEIRDLDSLPFPAWDLIDVDRYRRIWMEQHGYFSMNMVTTRGCPFHCNWCAKPIWGQRYHVRSPGNVIQELAWLRETYQPDHIWFADDIFGLKPGWLPEFSRLVAVSGDVTPYKCLSRVDLLLRDEEIQALKRSGAEIVWVGAESGSQEILNAMEKGTQIEQIYLASQQLRQSGIRVGFFLQFGYPGESREDIEKTLKMVREIMPDDIGMSVSYPLPGTRFYNRVVDQLGEKQNWYDSSDMAMMYQGPFSTAYYRQLHKTLHKEFRLRRAWRELVTLLRQPVRIRDRSLRLPAALAYRAVTLPLDRWRLRQLEKAPHLSIGPLDPAMSLDEAARPSPQT